MKITNFDWDEKNEIHISFHNVTPEEAEEVFIDNPIYRKSREGKYLAFGQTLEGRYLTVVFVCKRKGIIRVITARDMDKKERKLYRREKGI